MLKNIVKVLLENNCDLEIGRNVAIKNNRVKIKSYKLTILKLLLRDQNKYILNWLRDN